MLLSHLFRLATIATVLSLVALPSTAAMPERPKPFGFIEENAEARINFSGKLRMLTQRIASSACHLSQGIEEARTSLIKDPIEFEAILGAHEHGDTALGIVHPETRRKSLYRIANLREKWIPMKAAAGAIASGNGGPEDLDYIPSKNLELLTLAMRLVDELVKQYSNPNKITYANLLLVDISGRQRMLSQKMSKEACMAGSTFATKDTLDSLAGTLKIFEASLDALQNGLPQVGISPPPNEAISEGLEVVSGNWQTVRPMLSTVLSGGALSRQEEADKFAQLNVTLANMHKVVGMYASAAKNTWGFGTTQANTN